ncbi:hypothetical protein [Streptomyces virginiae]|uniref:hypothetical protein n=1 Tax=Streptomyces virginiae TaxID=1961 RepID=UPI0036D153B3
MNTIDHGGMVNQFEELLRFPQSGIRQSNAKRWTLSSRFGEMDTIHLPQSRAGRLDLPQQPGLPTAKSGFKPFLDLNQPQ